MARQSIVAKVIGSDKPFHAKALRVVKWGFRKLLTVAHSRLGVLFHKDYWCNQFTSVPSVVKV